MDQILSGYLKDDGSFCAKSEPSESWLRSPFRDARKKGFLRLNNKMTINGGRAFGIYQLTETGKIEAVAARTRVLAIRTDRAKWGEDFMTARREAVLQRKLAENATDDVPAP